MPDLSKLRSSIQGNDIDEPSLEAEVKEGLEKLVDEPEPVVKPEPEPEPEPEPDEEPELDDDGEPVVKPADEPVLPDNYYRAAKHQGWSDEEIQDLFSHSPEQALKTFAKIHESTNFITSQTAALGRMSVEYGKKLAAPEPESKPKTLDVAALKKRIGEDDPAALALLDAMVEQNVVLMSEIEDLKKSSRSSNRPVETSPEETEIWGKINGFFDDPDTQLYEDLYGKTESNKAWDVTLNGEQMRNRMSLIQQADQIRAGALLQGTRMDYSDALQRAHLVVSDKMKEKVIRTKIVSGLKKREQGITVRSSVQSRRSAVGSNVPPSIKKAEGTVKKGLRKLFGGYVE